MLGTMPARKPKKRESAEATPPKRQPPKRTGKPLNVWIDASLRDAIDTLVDESKPRTSLTAIVELALEEYLTRQKRWPPTSVQQPSPPAEG
jgi:hypothetical protein